MLRGDWFKLCSAFVDREKVFDHVTNKLVVISHVNATHGFWIEDGMSNWHRTECDLSVLSPLERLAYAAD